MSSGPLNPKRPRPFRSAVFRGLGGFIPPLLTIVVFVWVFGTVRDYVLEPVERGSRFMLSWAIADIIRDENKHGATEIFEGQAYRRMSDDGYVPSYVYSRVRQADGDPTASDYTAQGIYQRYVEVTFLKPFYVIPAFLAIFILILYLLGKLLAGRLGQFVWATIERLILSVPLVRNVYSSIKQVTDFVLKQRDLEYTRVVAVEYPRKATWSLGFVTGESLLDIREAANEPVLAVLIPTSPMPVTGFTVTVLKSETVDLNITVDQALEYIVSCGVVVPSHQMHSVTSTEPRRELEGKPLYGEGKPRTEEEAAGEQSKPKPPDVEGDGDPRGRRRPPDFIDPSTPGSAPDPSLPFFSRGDA